jgi:type II secretory pathway pseudopilin PulG
MYGTDHLVIPSLTVQTRSCRLRPRGFTLVEAVMVLLIILTVIGALTPSVIRQITHARVNRAARVIAADFSLAQSTASRSRKPVLLTVDSTARTLTVSDAPTATQLFIRRLGIDSDFKLLRLVATPATVLVFPSGMGSASVVVQVGDASYMQVVNVSRAGQIRVQ